MVASSHESKDFDNASILDFPGFLEKQRDLNPGCLPHFSSFWIFLTVVPSIPHHKRFRASSKETVRSRDHCSSS
jgi:hypothetical protein